MVRGHGTGASDTHLCPFFLLTGSRPRPLSIVLKRVTPIGREKAMGHRKHGEGVSSTNFLRKVPLCLKMMLACFYVSTREQIDTWPGSVE